MSKYNKLIKYYTRMLRNTTFDQVKDFPNNIEQIFYDDLVEEPVEIYGYNGWYRKHIMMCKLKNGLFLHYNLHMDFRTDTSIFEVTVSSLKDDLSKLSKITSHM